MNPEPIPRLLPGSKLGDEVEAIGGPMHGEKIPLMGVVAPYWEWDEHALEFQHRGVYFWKNADDGTIVGVWQPND